MGGAFAGANAPAVFEKVATVFLLVPVHKQDMRLQLFPRPPHNQRIHILGKLCVLVALAHTFKRLCFPAKCFHFLTDAVSRRIAVSIQGSEPRM
jgi:hypothetical protein